MKIRLPETCLVFLIGASGSGKSSLAKKLFDPYEILSSDHFRAVISNDESDQEASTDAFEVLHRLVEMRLKRGLFTVVDATNVKREARRPLLKISRQYHFLTAAIILDFNEDKCIQRNQERTYRIVDSEVIRKQIDDLQFSLRVLKKEGFSFIYRFTSPEELSELSLEKFSLKNNRRKEKGPFDIIGDIHGCFDELYELLHRLGYQIRLNIHGNEESFSIRHSENRIPVFLGDLVNKGPKNIRVLRFVMDLVNENMAYCVLGNHEKKLLYYLRGKDSRLRGGLQDTIEQLSGYSAEFRNSVVEFIRRLSDHYVFDHGNLVVAHAGLREEMQGRTSMGVRNFCMYGENSDDVDEYGMPVRYSWVQNYRGKARVVFGHTPILEPEWYNRTIDIDTGCVYGGRLTALRYPELEMVSVQARKIYYQSRSPLPQHLSLQS